MTEMTASVAAPAVALRTVKYKSPTARGRLPVLILFLPPALLLFTLFVILPMGEAAWYSLYRWNGYGTPTDFVGIRNFSVLFNNAAFTQALVNNGLIIVVSLLLHRGRHVPPDLLSSLRAGGCRGRSDLALRL